MDTEHLVNMLIEACDNKRAEEIMKFDVMSSTSLNETTITLNACSNTVSVLKSRPVYQLFSHYYDELTYDMPYGLWLDIMYSLMSVTYSDETNNIFCE